MTSTTTVPDLPPCGCPGCASKAALAAALLRADHLQHEHDCMHAELKAARHSIEVLVSYLERFGRCKDTCTHSSACTCGFAGAILDAGAALP